MKKIIDGKVYDTATAECVGEWNNDYYPNDFNRVDETMYRKKTGEFFLYLSGGPLSRYGTESGNNRGWGEYIRPIDFDAAKQWAEEKLSGDEYEKIFGEVTEDDSSIIISATISKAAHAKLKNELSKGKKNFGAILDELIVNNL